MKHKKIPNKINKNKSPFRQSLAELRSNKDKKKEAHKSNSESLFQKIIRKEEKSIKFYEAVVTLAGVQCLPVDSLCPLFEKPALRKVLINSRGKEKQSGIYPFRYYTERK